MITTVEWATEGIVIITELTTDGGEIVLNAGIECDIIIQRKEFTTENKTIIHVGGEQLESIRWIDYVRLVASTGIVIADAK